MSRDEISESEYAPWLAAAMASGVVMTAFRSSWISVFPPLLMVLPVSYLTAGMSSPRWLERVQWLSIIPLGAFFLIDSDSCWPAQGARIAVPLVIAVMAAVSASHKTSIAAASSNILRYGMYFVIGTVMVAVLPGMKWENLKTQEVQWDPMLIPVLLLPVIGGRKTDKRPLKGAAALLVTLSVLAAGLYEGSKGVYAAARMNISGNIRIESITASGMTLGYYIFVCFLLSRSGELWENRGGNRESGVWISTITMLLLTWSGWNLRSDALAGLIALVWSIIPLGNNLAKFVKIVLDKT